MGITDHLTTLPLQVTDFFLLLFYGPLTAHHSGVRGVASAQSTFEHDTRQELLIRSKTQLSGDNLSSWSLGGPLGIRTHNGTNCELRSEEAFQVLANCLRACSQIALNMATNICRIVHRGNVAVLWPDH